MVTIKFDKDMYKWGETVRVEYNDVPTSSLAVVAPRVKPPPHAGISKTISGNGVFTYELPIGASYSIGEWEVVLIADRKQIASDTMVVVIGATPPGKINKADFLAELQKHGRIRIGQIPPSASANYSWTYTPSLFEGILRYVIFRFPGGSDIHISNIKNPPICVENIDFVESCFPIGEGDRELFDEKEALDAIDKLPSVTLLICLWIEEVGLQNLTRHHAIYVYCLSLGAFAAAGVKYEQFAPKPSKLDATKVIRDLALGVYFYSEGAFLSGNKLTNCDY
jgi:hypothetical protein